MGRRTAAFAIDWAVAWLLSFPFGSTGAGVPVAQGVIFLLVWLLSRIYVPYQNQGQTLGRWALDMRVIERRSSRVPGLFELVKRESVTGVGALLVVMTLGNLTIANPGIVLLAVPLFADCLPAWLDPDQRLAFHDRVARTAIVSARRGYSLDLKLKRLLAEVSRRMKQ